MNDTTKTKWDATYQSAYYKEWRKTKKEHLAEYQKKWRKENKEYLQQYFKENKEKIVEINKVYRETHPEQRKENWNKWYQTNKIRSPKRRFTEAKSMAKKRDIEWSLTLEEYVDLIILPCYYCANKLGEPVKRSIGLDRLDSNKGYELTNVVSCCNNCNVMKNSFLTPEEMQLVAKTLIEFRQQQAKNVEETLQ
jgi:hypothetical protein